MFTEQQFNQICDFTRQHLAETFAITNQEWVKRFPRAAEYRWRHTLNVLRNAEKILEGERLDQGVLNVIRVSAILHDISMFECEHAVHGRVGAETARKYLSGQGYADDFVSRVSQAIAEHGVDFDDFAPFEMGERFSLEGKILIEADILDKLGASAITESLLVLGKEDRLGFESRSALEEGRAMERAKYFRDYFWTETGKRMAEDRFSFFLSFLQQLSEEIVEETSGGS